MPFVGQPTNPAECATRSTMGVSGMKSARRGAPQREVCCHSNKSMGRPAAIAMLCFAMSCVGTSRLSHSADGSVAADSGVGLPSDAGSMDGGSTGELDSGTPIGAPVTIAWDNPTTFADGSAIPDPSALLIRLYWGEAGKPRSRSEDVGRATSYQFSGLPRGTYSVAVTAIDPGTNFESAPSTPIEVVIP